jgi:hypothetical protein
MGMSSLDKPDPEQNKQVNDFDPPLHEEEVEHSVDDRETEKSGEKKEPAEEEANKQKSAVIAKETLLRVTGGLL